MEILHLLLVSLRTCFFCTLLAFWDSFLSSIVRQIHNLCAESSSPHRPGWTAGTKSSRDQNSFPRTPNSSWELLVHDAGGCSWTETAIDFDDSTHFCCFSRIDASRPSRIPGRDEALMVQSLGKDLRGYGFDHFSAVSPFAFGNWRFAASRKLRCKPSFPSWEELETRTHLTSHYTSRSPESLSSIQVVVENISSHPPAPAEFTSAICLEETEHYALQSGTLQSLRDLIQPFSRILSSYVTIDDHPSRSQLGSSVFTRMRMHMDDLQSRSMEITMRDSTLSVLGLIRCFAGIDRYTAFLVAWNANQWMSIVTIPGYRPVNMDQGFSATEEAASVKVHTPVFHTLQLKSGIFHGDTSKFLCDLRMLPSPETYPMKSIEGGESNSEEQQVFDTSSSVTEMLPEMDEENKKQQPGTWWDKDAVVLGGKLKQKDEDGNKEAETWWDEDAVLLGDAGEMSYGGFEQGKPVSTLANKPRKSFFSVYKRKFKAITTSFSHNSTQ